MERKDKLKETDVKNQTCYYFDDIIGVMDRVVILILMISY